MYIRFVAPSPVRRGRNAAGGLFGAAYRAFGDRNGTPDGIRQAIGDEIDWFHWHLPIPNRFGIVTRKSDRRYGGVCWFRDDARDCIAHAYALSALLEESGVPVTRLITDAPGDIVYRDDQQIVAMPPRC